MKRLFMIIMICLLLIIILISTNTIVFSGTPGDDMNINESILMKLKDLRIDLQNAIYDELEPDKLMSYNDFLKEDYSNQQEYSGIWSTVLHKNLDKLNIEVHSSSTLKGYPVTNLIDKKIETAWVPGKKGIKGDGIGELISIDLNLKIHSLNCPVILDYFGMIPGYLKNDKTWEQNNRVKSALLIIERDRFDSEKYISYKDYAILRLKFTDFKGIQIFNIDSYNEIEGDMNIYKRLWIVIENVYKGTKFDDTCISELVIGGEIGVADLEPL